MSRYHVLAVLVVGLLVAACGGNEGDDSNNATANNGTANNGTSNNGTSNNGTSNNGTSNNGTSNNGTANNNVGNNSTVDPDAGMPDDTGMPDAEFVEPDDSTHAPGFWPPGRYTDLLVRSGARLTANAVVSEEGNASLLSFDDAVTGEACILRPTTGGEWYCLPTRALSPPHATEIYTDPDCTMEAVAMTGPTCADGVTVVMTDDYGEDDDQVERVVRLSKASGRAFRKLNNGTCEPLPTSLDLSAWTVTEEVPLAEYVKFSNHLLPVDDKLAVHLLRGEDGSRAAYGLWLREWDAAASLELVSPDSDTPQVLRALPAEAQYYDLDPRARNFVNGPLVNLSCDSFNDGGYNIEDPSIPYGILLPTGQAPPSLTRLGMFIQGFQGPSRVYTAYHTVEDTATRYCSVPIVGGGPTGPRFGYNLREEVDVPEGYTLHRLSAGTLATSFPRIEQTIDTRAGGLRFAHYETVLRVPLMPVGREPNKVAPTLYQDGEPLGSFWVDGVLRAAVPLEESGARERYQGEIRYWSDGNCTQPLGENGEGRVQTLTPYPTDVCAPRGTGVGVYVNEAPEQLSYNQRTYSGFGEELGCRAGNNGNPGWRNPVRRLTLPDPLIIDVPLAQR